MIVAIMDGVTHSETPDTEVRAREYLLGLCWPDNERHCVKCGAGSPYALRTGRLRCGNCGYTFHDFSGRWVNKGNLTCATWLELIRLFAAEETIKSIAVKLGMSYNTAYKAVSTLRRAILAHALDAAVLLDPERGPGLSTEKDKAPPGAGRPGPVFGIVEERDFAFADYLPDFTAETILHFKLNFMLRTTRLGGIVFTDHYRNYSSLVCCPGDEIECGYFDTDDATIPFGEDSPFGTYARERIIKFHGVTKQRFPLYLKELEFRYNHRGRDIMPILSQYLCALVPKLD
jgi:transposase